MIRRCAGLLRIDGRVQSTTSEEKVSLLMQDQAAVCTDTPTNQQAGQPPTPQNAVRSWLLRAVALFIKPAHFFATFDDLARPVVVLVATLCLGVASMVDRIEQHILRAEMGQGVSGWSELSPWLLHSWGTLWIALLVCGALNVPLFWYLGGWWYRLRLKWSGATALDSLRPRLLFVYSSLVYALPVVLVMIGETLLFPNYRLARDAEGSWTLIFVLLSFWSVVVSYCGATRTFALARRKALLWFLLLPWTLYAVELGLWMWLFEAFNAAMTETV